MVRTLTINQNQLSYFARLDKPALQVLGDRQAIVAGLFEVFSDYNLELSSFYFEGIANNPTSIGVNVSLGEFGIYKLKADRIELVAENFGSDITAEKFPYVLHSGSEWVRSTLSASFKSHAFAYVCHGKLSEGHSEEFLLGLPNKQLLDYGRSLGSGFIENWVDDEIGGKVKLWVDHSTVLDGGLYIQLFATVDSDAVDYFKVLNRGLKVFYEGLQAIGIEVVREVPFDDEGDKK